MTPVTSASKTDGVPFVYKITNGVLCYYGSTGMTLDERKRLHMSKYNVCSSRVITQGELPWTMEVVEYVACTTKDELEDREAFYIMNNECVNMVVPGNIRRAGGMKAYDRQRYQENAEEIKAKNRQYNQDNKESIEAKARVKHDCVICGGRYRWSDKSKHFKTKKHQKALAEAVSIHSPPPPPTVINNNLTHCTDITINQ